MVKFLWHLDEHKLLNKNAVTGKIIYADDQYVN